MLNNRKATILEFLTEWDWQSAVNAMFTLCVTPVLYQSNYETMVEGFLLSSLKSRNIFYKVYVRFISFIYDLLTQRTRLDLTARPTTKIDLVPPRYHKVLT